MNSRQQRTGPFGYRPGPERSPAGPPEETLIADARARLTPADMVDCKLRALLITSSLPVSSRRVGVPRDHGRIVNRF